jgi:hypothetical protein
MSGETVAPIRYKLSLSQARYYCRRPECASITTMEGYARMLEGEGIEVTALHATSLEANASQSTVWTALSGLSW